MIDRSLNPGSVGLVDLGFFTRNEEQKEKPTSTTPLEDSGVITPNDPNLSAGGSQNEIAGAVFTTASGLPVGTVAGELAKEADPSLFSELIQFGKELTGQAASDIILAMAEQPINNLFHVGQPDRPVTEAEYVEYNKRLRNLQAEVRDIRKVTRPDDVPFQQTSFITDEFKLKKKKPLSSASIFGLTMFAGLFIIPDTREYIFDGIKKLKG